MADGYEPGEWVDTAPIGGMKTWCCSYTKDGLRYSIDLMGTDPEQVLNDNCDAFEGFTVDGELMSTAKAVKSDRREGD
ncbi:hypothetical protein [Sulfitobacter pacificus]|uniref:hypothetical protein n=1 Tax=Sulfitobacter pacificus TaxID=1499314 RepID=UPI003105F450